VHVKPWVSLREFRARGKLECFALRLASVLEKRIPTKESAGSAAHWQQAASSAETRLHMAR
jgi:hypothetical protein